MLNNKRKVNIIPLGQNCMPRTILTRWGVKAPKILGELTYPFDIAVFGMPEITKTLQRDFNEFYDNWEHNGKFWVKTPNCIEFSHEKNFGLDDKYKLMLLYQKRIENFRKAMQNEKPVLFVQILGDSEEIDAQYAQLLKYRQERPFKMVVIDTEDVVNIVRHSDIRMLKVPLPTPEYKLNWWRKEYYNSPAGKTFEKQIAQFCQNTIDNYM